VSAGEADVGVEGGGEAAQEGDGGFGSAFLDPLGIISRVLGAHLAGVVAGHLGAFAN
jgi:hypothetical protein